MPDVWPMVAELDAAMQERLADVLETCGTDPLQACADAMMANSVHDR